MFKLLSTKFEGLFNMECNSCLPVSHHIHSDYITCRLNDIQQFLNRCWLIVVNARFKVAPEEKVNMWKPGSLVCSSLVLWQFLPATKSYIAVGYGF